MRNLLFKKKIFKKQNIPVYISSATKIVLWRDKSILRLILCLKIDKKTEKH